MSASLVRAILDAAFLIAVAVWAGSSLGVLAGLLPLAGRVLDPPAAVRLLRAVLARYYLWGATCGALALPAALGAPLSFPEYRGAWVGVQALLIVAGTLAMLAGANSPPPAPDDPAPSQLERLRRRAGRLAAVVLAINLTLLAAFAFRPPPQTAGIREPTPQERARRAAAAAVPPAPPRLD